MRRLALSLIVLPAIAHAQDAERGKALAERWCASCHVVTAGAKSGSANGLPSFQALATDPKVTEGTLRAAMTTQHGRMPDLSLGKRQQDDLVAYIFSLRPR
jgi:mono/diheme cytochrome c family protein